MKFLIDFIDSTEESDITSYLQSFSAVVVKTYNKFAKTYLIESPVAPPSSPIVDVVVNDDAEVLDLLNTTYYLDSKFGTLITDGSMPLISLTNTDDNWWKFYSFAKPDLEKEVYQLNRRGSGNVIYVLDSGCNINHPEFAGSDVTNLWSFNNDFTDVNGHGTAICGVIAGQTCGIANPTVKNVKIFHSGVPTYQSDLLSALDAIYNDFANSNIPGYYIINTSWAIPKNTYVENKIRAMIDAGLVFVAAAGNNGVAIENVTPASMNEVITVGSYNKDLMPSNFSNYTGGSDISYTSGETNFGALDGWGPGEEIKIPTLNGSYGVAAGTSMSAAIHSACITYNLSHVNYPENYDRTIYNFAKEFSFMRSDMLDLGDPKYINSVNRLTTFNDDLSPKMERTPISTSLKLTQGSTTNLIEIVNPKYIEKVEFAQPLPGNLTILPQGEIYGVVPTYPDRYVRLTIPTTATYLDGTVETFDFILHIMAPDWNTDTDSTGDAELDVKLAYDFGCGQYGGCIYFEHTCIANCPSGGWCFKGTSVCPKGAFGCQCW